MLSRDALLIGGIGGYERFAYLGNDMPMTPRVGGDDRAPSAEPRPKEAWKNTTC
jgi:hypothetical protein